MKRRTMLKGVGAGTVAVVAAGTSAAYEPTNCDGKICCRDCPSYCPDCANCRDCSGDGIEN